MGVTYSSTTTASSKEIAASSSSQSSESSEVKKDPRDTFRGLAFSKTESLVRIFCERYVPPILDRVDLTFLIKNAMDSSNPDEIVKNLYDIFEDKALCRTYEVLACIILLCEGDWKARLGLLFEVYKCAGTDDIYHEDIRMAVQSIAAGLCRLWKHSKWTYDEMYTLSENMANHAFMKVGKCFEDISCAIPIYTTLFCAIHSAVMSFTLLFYHIPYHTQKTYIFEQSCCAYLPSSMLHVY